MEKAHSEFCCCDGCESLAHIWDINNSLTSLQRSVWRRLCCACVPVWAQVTVTKNSTMQSVGSMFRLFCTQLSTIGSTQALYKQTNVAPLIVGGVAIDLTFHFIVTETTCQFCIRSTALGINENSAYACKTIDAVARAKPYEFCKTLGLDSVFKWTEFVVAGHTIRIQKADHVPIRGRQHCVTPAGVTVFDTNPIRDLCCNCNCICNCMCLTISGAGLVQNEFGSMVPRVTAETACLYNNSWRFPSGVVISLFKPDAGLNFLRFACWKMDETSGARIDSENTYHLTNNTSVGSVAGKIVNAARFTGANYLEHADSSLLRLSGFNATVVSWVRLTNITNTMTIISKTAGTIADGYGWKIAYNQPTGRFTFSIGNGTTIFTVSADTFGAVVAGAWNMITVKIDVDTHRISIQVNNQAADTVAFTGTVAGPTVKLYFGRQDSVTDPQYLVGDIDEVQMSRTLIAHDAIVSSLYNGGAGVTCVADDKCYLKMTSTGPFDLSTTPLTVLLGGPTAKCPRPTAEWELIEKPTAFMPFSHPIFMALRCVSPDSRCEVNVGSCCANGRTIFPAALQCNVATTCPGCPTINMTLAYRYLGNWWEGTANMCGHLITIRIACPFTSLYIDGTPCVGTMPSLGSASCDPIHSVFSAVFGGIGCCGGSSLVSPTITVTVYE